MRRHEGGDAFLVVLLAVFVHVGALGFLRNVEFTYDDEAIVQGNPRLQIDSAADLRRLATEKYWGDQYQAERLWRPLPLLSFAIDTTLLGPQPHRYRWTSVALHALAAWLALLLFRQLLPRRLALIGALLFATHPIHAEATAGVVGRAEVLALLGNLGGVLLHLRARRAQRWWAWSSLYLLAGACFFLGFLGKEIALTGPVVLIAVEVALRRPPAERTRTWLARLRLAAPYLFYAGVIVLYGVARWYALGDLVSQEGARTLGDMAFEQRLYVAGHVALQSWSSLVIPHVTSAHYPFAEPSVSSSIPLLGIHTIVVVGSLLLLARTHRLARALGLGVLATYMSMGPVLNLVPIGVIRADRLLYTPSLYGCLAITTGLAALVWLVTLKRPARRREVWVWVLGATLALYAWVGVKNVRAWTDNETLWRTSVERFPEDPRPKLALGRRLLGISEMGDVHPDHPPRDPALLREEAKTLLHQAALGFTPGKPGWPRQAAEARASLGNVLLTEHPETARTLFLQAQQIDSGCAEASLGLVQYHQARAERETNPAIKQRELNYAEKEARALANRVAPHDYHAWLAWGGTLSGLQGRDADADAAYTKAISLQTSPWQAHFNRARLRRLGTKDLAGAFSDYQRVVELLLRRAPPELQRSPEIRRILPQALLYQAVLALKLARPDARTVAQQSQRVLKLLYPKTRELQVVSAVLEQAR